MTTQNTSAVSGRMMGLSEATALIRGGGHFSVAGDEALLRQLPRGHWIGGTIPYFMGQDGGVTTRDQLYVAQVPVINEAFTPSDEEVAEAREIVDLFEANPGAGTIGWKGGMLDRPHLSRARQLLAQVED